MGGNSRQEKAAAHKAMCERLWRDIGEGIQDDELIEAAPEGWTPTPTMMNYARAHVSARPLATIGEIAAEAGVVKETVSHWRHGHCYRAWMANVLMAAAGVATSHVWRACHEKAMAGDAGCIRMWARRFDPVYVLALAASEGKRPDASSVPDGLEKAAQAAIDGD